MGSGGAGANSVVVENPIPDWARADFTTFLNRSRAYSEKHSKVLTLYTYAGSIPNENDTYAKRNQDEIDGINALATRARNGSAIVLKGRSLVFKNLNGDNININPNSDNAYDVSAENVLQELDEEILPS